MTAAKKGNWAKEKIREKLKEAHEQENGFNKEMSKIDKQIGQLQIRKRKLARLISKNMIYRKKLIDIL